MPSGDGWLARLPPLTQPMTPAMLAGLAEAARMHGNGRIEISKRGNLQLRGLPGPDGTALAEALAAAGFDLPQGIPISLDPLADLSGLGEAARALVRHLHAAIEAEGLSERLAPKLSLAIDLGTPLAPRSLLADIRLALRGQQVHVALGGTAEQATPLGWIAAGEAVSTVLALLAHLANHGRESRFTGPHGHARDPDFAALALFRPGAAPAGPTPATTIGALAGFPLTVHGIGFPFGQVEADDLAALAEASSGLLAIAPASDRALLLAGRADAVAATLLRAEARGFITAAGDVRRHIAACAGSEGCLSGHYATRSLARSLAARLGPLLDGSLTLHLSGCRKGCACPDAAAFTIAGIDKSAALVLDGQARDAPAAIGSPEGLAARLAELARCVSTRPFGETARAALDRLDPFGRTTQTPPPDDRLGGPQDAAG